MLDRVARMSSEEVVWYLTMGMIGNGLFVAPILTYVIPAYYGRYATASVLPVNPKLSWIIQECPAFFIPLYLLVTCSNPVAPMNRLVLSLMIIHYFQRSFIYAFLIRSSKPVPISITFFAFLFCTWNGFQQGLSLTQVNQVSGDLLSPNILVGVGMWVLGFSANLHADHILRNLRKPGETGYKIPRGGLFEYVSAANYFSETIEWCGFAVAAWNLPALAFAIYTLANLLPRGLSHHQWYLEKFEDYPKDRKAFLPFLL